MANPPLSNFKTTKDKKKKQKTKKKRKKERKEKKRKKSQSQVLETINLSHLWNQFVVIQSRADAWPLF